MLEEVPENTPVTWCHRMVLTGRGRAVEEFIAIFACMPRIAFSTAAGAEDDVLRFKLSRRWS